MPNPNVLSPEPSLLMKLGSIARHVEEFTGPGGVPEDLEAAKSLLTDPEVVHWMGKMDQRAFLPVMRSEG